MYYLKILFAMICVLVFAGVSSTYADNLDWDDITSRYEYDRNDDELEISIMLEDVRVTPDDDYDVLLTVDGKRYSKSMNYSSSRDELKATFTFNNIDSDELDDYLKIEFEVVDEFNNIEFD